MTTETPTRTVIHWPSDDARDLWTVEETPNGYYPLKGPYRLEPDHVTLLRYMAAADDVALDRRPYEIKRDAGLVESAIYGGILGWLEDRLLVRRTPRASVDDFYGWRLTDAGRSALALEETR